MAKTATVVLMCAVPDSGQTSDPKQLQRTGYVRLSVDEEMWRLDQDLAAGFEAPADEGETIVRLPHPLCGNRGLRVTVIANNVRLFVGNRRCHQRRQTA